MKYLPKIIAVTLMWGVVLGIIFYVDPDAIKDTLIPGVYLPLILSMAVSCWYSILLITKSLKTAGLVTIVIVIAMVTTIFRYMNVLVGVALVGMIVSLGLTSTHES